MTDIPKFKPRDMVGGLSKVLTTHEVIRNGIHQRAEEEQKAHTARDAQLNAKARLDGKTKP